SLAELVDEPLITLTKGSNIRATTEAYFAAKGRPFAPAFTLMQHYTIGPMVETGLGVALLPVAATFGLREQAGLRVVPLKEKDFVREIGLLKRKGEPLTAAADAFYRATVQAVEAGHPRAQAKPRSRAR
ncbi:MAG TPA: LysR substrate-binding domain-containing protein, partial [Ramlibacter sp.]|nr:LysR substrate-binding domain-containing protein [Ramlibacter sp.]